MPLQSCCIRKASITNMTFEGIFKCARTSKDLKPFLFLQIGLFVGTLVNQNAGKQTKVLANKPKCWQTNQNAVKQTKILTNKPKF